MSTVDIYSDFPGIWYVKTLWKLSEKFEKSLVRLDTLKFQLIEQDGTLVMEEEYERAMNSDTSYPIILSPDGKVMDGVHRLNKLHWQGIEWVEAIQLPYLPPSDEHARVLVSNLRPNIELRRQNGGGT